MARSQVAFVINLMLRLLSVIEDDSFRFFEESNV